MAYFVFGPRKSSVLYLSFDFPVVGLFFFNLASAAAALSLRILSLSSSVRLLSTFGFGKSSLLAVVSTRCPCLILFKYIYIGD
jgi:hypothetical protein